MHWPWASYLTCVSWPDQALVADWTRLVQFLEQGGDINTVHPNNKHGTALAGAARSGNEPIVSLLLDQGSDVNIVGGDFGTALAAAAISGNQQIVTLLLDRGADIDTVGGDYGTALAAAASWGNEQIVKLLLDRRAKINVNSVNFKKEKEKERNKRRKKYCTALTAALCKGHWGVARLLLDRGADTNVDSKTYKTALYVAATNGFRGINYEMVALFLHRGANPNKIIVGTDYAYFYGNSHPGYNYTVLTSAACWGNEQIVKLLLDRGANVNTVHVGNRHATALAGAARSGYEDIVRLLLDRGAHVNIVGGELGTALASAAYGGHKTTVRLLLDRGADVNIVGGNLHTALTSAAFSGSEETVRLLLDSGADVTTVGGELGTALAGGAKSGNAEIVRLLLDRGADVNIVSGDLGTALAYAAHEGHETTVRLLLDRGADVNIVSGNLGTALAYAAYGGHEATVRLLLDRGADVNIVGGNLQSTALIAAAFSGHEETVRLLLDSGADVNTVGGNYSTALFVVVSHPNMNIYKAMRIVRLLVDQGPDVINTVIVGNKDGTALNYTAYHGGQDMYMLKLLLDLGADINTVGGYFGTALAAAVARRERGVDPKEMVELLLERGAGINTVGGRYGTALATAAYMGDMEIVRLLLDQGADINTVGGYYGTTFGAALGANQKKIVRLLLERSELDYSIVHGKYGSILGWGLYRNNVKVLKQSLKAGSDLNLVGGFYDTTSGTFPTTLDAAAAANQLNSSTKYHALLPRPADLTPLPPFPMPAPYIKQHEPRRRTDIIAIESAFQIEFSEGAPITPEQADTPCAELKEEILIRSLVSLVGINADAAQRLSAWIRRDIRFFISQNFDFGLAYAASCLAWKHFNDATDDAISVQRFLWHKHARKLLESRITAISTDSDPSGSAQELITTPYSIMPRRIWDLKSNRVIDFIMLHSHFQSISQMGSGSPSQLGYPNFWAVTHSWTNDMEPAMTSINQYEWPVPIPKGITLDDVRSELRTLGAEYIWLDILCLRQQHGDDDGGTGSSEDNLLRQSEWKLDVPTIGNIYRAAERLVRYFNGLGRKFRLDNWDDQRHWLKRAWTLQEIMSENTTLNGGVSEDEGSGGFIMNRRSVDKATTFRQVIRPVLRLAEQVKSGCCMYDLTREMSRRFSSKDIDKLAGLFYLLRTTQLPCYGITTSEEDVWTRSFHLLHMARKVELLFDFPYRASETQWFPTWTQVMEWPERDSNFEHTSPELLQTASAVTGQSPRDPKHGLFIPDLTVISQVCLHTTDDPREYKVRVGDNKVNVKVFGFYTPYVSQQPLAINTDKELALVTFKLGHSCNWVIGEVLSAPYQSATACGIKKGAIGLKKLGVLRTDSCSRLLFPGNKGGTVLSKADCVFV